MALVSTFAFVLAMLALGRALAWRAVVGPDAAHTLNQVVLYACLPAAILRHAPKLSFEPALLGIVAIPWLLVLIGVLLVLGLAKWRGLGRAETAVLLLLCTLGNTSFLGFAVIPVLAGEAALPHAVLYDQLGSFLQLSSFGVITLAVYGGDARPSSAALVQRVVTFPPFLTLVAALTLVPAELPAVVDGLLARLEGALLPVAALAIGVQLRLRIPRERVGLLALGLVTKLVVMPALALALCLAFGLTGDMRAAAVFEAGMPGMITAAALLGSAKLAGDLAAALVGYGIVVAMLTLPLWKWLLALVG